MQRLCVPMAIVLLGAPAASGYYYNWTGGTGNWNVASNWDIGSFFGLPKSTDYATIGNGGSAIVSAPATIRTTYVHGNSMLDIRDDLLMPSGQLRIGEASVGHVVQSDGLMQASTLQFGENFGNPGGTYELSGSGRIMVNLAYIGKRSPADMMQTGGSFETPGVVELGWGRSSTYHLLGGSFAAETLSIAGADHPGWPGSQSVFEVGAGGVLEVQALRIAEQSDNSGVFRILAAAADITVTQSLSIYGGWQAVPGSNVRMEGAGLDIRSTSASAVEGLANTSFVFDSAPGVAQLVEVASADLGDTPSRALIGFQIGSIAVQSGEVRLVDNADNQGDGAGNEVLYLDSLRLDAGSSIDLAGRTIYTRTAVIDPSAMVTDSVGGGEIRPLVPEPGMIAIVMISSAIGVGRRRCAEPVRLGSK